MTIKTHANPTIGGLLVEARDRMSLSKAKAARALDTTDLTYRLWERGAQMPGLERTEAFAEFCGVSRYVVLAAMGILTADEAAILDRAVNVAIPG